MLCNLQTLSRFSNIRALLQLLKTQRVNSLLPLNSLVVETRATKSKSTLLNVKTQLLTALQQSRTKTRMQPNNNIAAFLMLLSCGWGLISLPYSNINCSYKFIINRDAIQLRQQLRVLLSRQTRQKNIATNIETPSCHFNVYAQYTNVAHLLNMLQHANARSIYPLYFNQPRHIRALSYANWRALRSPSLAWPAFRYLFFFKLNPTVFLAFAKNTCMRTGVLFFFFLNTVYHRRELAVSRSYNLPTGSLTNLTQEPWISDFPIFCDSSAPGVELLFVNIISKF